MPKEILLDAGPGFQQTVIPDEDGFTVRSRHDVTPILDDVARQRSVDPKPRVISKNGVTYRHVGKVPLFVIHQMIKRTGRWPTNEELLDLLRSRDYSKLRATEEKF